MPMKADAIMILGGGISQDGTLKQTTINRLEKGLELFNQEVAENIILSGKYSSDLDYTPVTTEARAMARYLEEKGVPADKIYLEEESKDTIGNAYFTKIKILEPKNWRNIVVVTSDFHIPRAKYIFRKVLGDGYKVTFVGAPTGFSYEKLEDLLEEERRVFNLIKSWIDDIPDGDDEAFKKFIFNVHPAYAHHEVVKTSQNRRSGQNSE